VPHAFPSEGYPLWTRQYAAAFNQPLSFDISSVTDMSDMFLVRFRLRLMSTIYSSSMQAVGHAKGCLRYRHTLTLPSLRAVLPPT
jgi:hypothetical protein